MSCLIKVIERCMFSGWSQLQRNAMSVWTLHTFIALLAALASGGKVRPQFGEEIGEVIAHLHHTCAEKTGAAEEDIQNCENGIFKEDQKLKCYMFCILEEASVADDDGVVDYEMLAALIPDDLSERVGKMINACKHLDTMDKDKCQRAFDVHKCTYTVDPDLYFIF